MRRPKQLRVLWLFAVAVLLVALIVLSVAVGSRDVSWADILAGLSGSAENLEEAAVVKRAPRTALALLVGAALGLSGAVMQGVTRNPLADPGILGVNMGASLAIVTGIAWFGLASADGYLWVAILGATPLKLALAGAATSAALASFVTAVSLPRGDVSSTIRSWLVGGVGGASWTSIQQMLPFLVIGLVISLLCARGLNSLALGDDLAAGLGERVAVVRVMAALGAVLLCGAATAIAGPIGFVGLVVPHACRLLVGVDHRWLLPFSALTGGCLVLAADILGRIVARPSEIDVGIITAIIGAPVFIAIVRRHKVSAL